MPTEEDRFAQERAQMVDEQLQGRDITDERVLEAMRSVPRHEFVPDDQRRFAYIDGPVRLAQGQTISQPYIVALMSQLLALQGQERVLEVGTGSGYQAAVLSCLVEQVYSLERIPELAFDAQRRLHRLGYLNVQVFERDGSGGLAEHAPYDGILVTAAAPSVPRPLKDQLAMKGRLIVPVGGQGGQSLELWQKMGDDDFDKRYVAPVAFVPLLGEHGWERDERPYWNW
jgi:protein-L-isoaspartate(D-aspartate) O-methyltransferase